MPIRYEKADRHIQSADVFTKARIVCSEKCGGLSLKRVIFPNSNEWLVLKENIRNNNKKYYIYSE